MSIQGIIIIDLIGIGLLILILNLLRTKKLHVGFAVVWFLAVTLLMVLISVPSLLYSLPSWVGATYPASALSLLGFIFIFLVLIFFSVQLSILSARQSRLIQDVAIEGLLKQEKLLEKDGSLPKDSATGSTPVGEFNMNLSEK